MQLLLVTLQDPHVLPQFPHAPDSLSVTTEVDYLYKEEGRIHTSLSSLMISIKNDEKAIVPTNSLLASDSGNMMMTQHFTLNTNQQYNLDDNITKCTDDSHVREFTPSSVPTEHYFTDDEGYLRFTK